MSRFFLLGPAKSGGTLLTRLLSQHPDVCVIRESYVAEPEKHSIANSREDKGEIHGIHRKVSDCWGKRLTAARASGDECRFSAEVKHTLEECWAHMGGGTARGDGWPFWGRHFLTLREAFPSSVRIFNTRHPAAIYHSAERFYGRGRGREFVDGALAVYNNFRIAFEGSRSPREGVNIFVRYEDAVDNPWDVCSFLWRSLGLDDSLGYIEYDRAKDPFPDRWGWVENSTQDIDKSIATGWEGKVSPGEWYSPDWDEFLERFDYGKETTFR